MKSTNNFQTSNPEMVTISRAEYEQFQAQSGRIAELEQQVSVLMEALRLARHKRLESGSFQWPRSEREARALTPQQYRWLMEGLSIDQPKAHRPVNGLEII